MQCSSHEGLCHLVPNHLKCLPVSLSAANSKHHKNDTKPVPNFQVKDYTLAFFIILFKKKLPQSLSRPAKLGIFYIKQLIAELERIFSSHIHGV